MSEEKNAKERILEASAELFSKYGFDATGVRKIVNKANVNISMINYYFKSKEGILLELTDIFFGEIEEEFAKHNLLDLSIEDRFEVVAEILTRIFRKNIDLFRVIILTNSVEKIEFNKIKAEKLKKIIYYIYGDELIRRYFANEVPELKLEIIGPGLVGLVSSHFLMKDIAENMLTIDFDDKFYEEYPKMITEIFLHGVKKKFEEFM
jgi:AcrR family transcriptional regulator